MQICTIEIKIAHCLHAVAAVPPWTHTAVASSSRASAAVYVYTDAIWEPHDLDGVYDKDKFLPCRPGRFINLGGRR